MAEVFKARLEGLGGFHKYIAIKKISPFVPQEQEFVEMFTREAKLAARLDHANIVRIHEFDMVQGQYYIAMEYVDGQDLSRVINKCRELDRRLRVPEVLQISLEICKGLAYAHGELAPGIPEVIHRDISPQNILLSRAGEVKITDFGIAKLASAASVTKVGGIKGKTSYLSPEQSRGDQVGFRSDLFSLGCVIWEMLTLRRLFIGDSDTEIMKKIQEGDIEPPSKHNADVPTVLDSVVLKLLERDPVQRYSSAAAAASDLEKIEGISRSTLLSELYRELFSVIGEDTGHYIDEEDDVLQPKFSRVVEKAGPESGIEKPADKPVLDIAPASLRGKKLPLIVTIVATIAVAVSLALVLPEFLGEKERISEPTTSPEPESPTKPPEEDALAVPEEIKPPETAVSEEDTEETEPAPEPPIKPTGRLFVNAIPWAKVYKGKRLLGDTPLENVKLPVGKHKIRLVNEVMKVDKTVIVTIKKNKATKKVYDLKE